MKKVILTIVFLVALTTSNFAQDPFIGEIRIFPYNFTPMGWLPCDGQTLNITQNQALYSLLGTTFGGDGRTTFMLPNLNGRVVVSAGQQPGGILYKVADKGGLESITLAPNQAPLASHNHTATFADPTYTAAVTDPVYGATATGTVSPKAKTGPGTLLPSPQGAYNGVSSSNLYSTTSNTNMAPSDLAITVNVTKTTAGSAVINKATPGAVTVQPNAAVGAAAPFDNRMPFLVLKYYIATEGIYPQRQ